MHGWKPNLPIQKNRCFLTSTLAKDDARLHAKGDVLAKDDAPLLLAVAQNSHGGLLLDVPILLAVARFDAQADDRLDVPPLTQRDVQPVARFVAQADERPAKRPWSNRKERRQVTAAPRNEASSLILRGKTEIGFT